MRNLMLGSLAALVLAGCGDQSTSSETTAKTEKVATAASVEAALGEHKGFAALVEKAGLTAAIDGPGSYTIFAPPDAALPKDDTSDDETAARQAATAFVVAHIAPGAMTRADIAKAVAANGGKTVIRSMGGTLLEASDADGKLMIAAEGGTPVAADSSEVQSGDDMVIGIAAPLTGS